MRMTLSTLNWRRREMVRWLVTCATEVGLYQTPPTFYIIVILHIKLLISKRCFFLLLTFLFSGLFVHLLSL